MRSSVSELDSIITEKFSIIKDEIVSEIRNYIDKNLNELSATMLTHIEDVEQEVKNEKMKTNKLIDKVERLEETCRLLKVQNEKMKTDLEKEDYSLAERLEDKTNPQLRKTLIFTNVAEEDGEDVDKYKKTSQIIAKKIKEVSNGAMTEEAALQAIKRCHRGHKKKFGSGPRPIYAAVTDWRLSEKIKEYFLSRSNSSGVYVDQMYGPRTTMRRQQALKLRKELKSSGRIVKGYVAFPARLMVLKPGQKEYELFEDFSKNKLIFDNK